MANSKIVLSSGEVLMDLTNDTVEPSKLLKGFTAHGPDGEPITGTMPNNGAVSGTIATKDGVYTVPQGFHDGSGKVGLDATEMAKLIPDNIRKNITLLGVEGAMSGTEDAKPQAKSVTPSFEEQQILPDAGYNYLSQVTVAAIKVTRAENSAGGTTVTIG